MSIIAADTIKSRTAGAAVTTSDGLYVGGACTSISSNVTGVSTAQGGVEFGAAGVGGTIRANGDTTLAGVVTATSFVGDGSGLTGVANTGFINATQLNVIGVATASSFVGNVTGNATGLTGTPNITVGNISAAAGDLTIRNVTGVAATFTGVLTYEDVTNVDSVGIVTARGGFEIGAAGVGGTITSVGNAEFVGIVTAKSDVNVGSAITMYASSGIITCTELSISGHGHADGSGALNLERNDASLEGGEIKFHRASDNAVQWTNDVYGNDSSAYMRWHSGGAVKAQLSTGGVITCTSVTETSDVALKTNIEPLTNVLDKINQLTGYKYDFTASDESSMGVIAQDVEKVFPELVRGEEGSKSLQYSGLIGALIESVKELSAKVAALESGS